jgi:hypothetical protein
MGISIHKYLQLICLAILFFSVDIGWIGINEVVL